MISAALRTIHMGYAGYGSISPYLFGSSSSSLQSPEDVEATLHMIRNTINMWDDADHGKTMVQDALTKTDFVFNTIRLKREKHSQKWFSDWRSLRLDEDYKKLIQSLSILEKRFSIAVMSRMTHTIQSTHDSNSHFAMHADSIKR